MKTNVSDKEFSQAVANEILVALKEEVTNLNPNFEKKFVEKMAVKLRSASTEENKKLINTMMICNDFKFSVVELLVENLVNEITS